MSQKSGLNKNASFLLSWDKIVGFRPQPQELFGATLPVQASPSRTRQDREKQSSSKRHPANPTLPWICLAAPWLGMQEGMEPGSLASSFRPPRSKQPAPGPGLPVRRRSVPSSGQSPPVPPVQSRQRLQLRFHPGFGGVLVF